MPPQRKATVAEPNQQPQIVKGQPPTAQDQFWLDLAKDESPSKSIERLDSYGKYLLGTVSVVGTALTGFGIFSPGAAGALHSGWFLVPVGLACASLALAVMGITPQVHKIKLREINSIRQYYARLILWRGWSITFAGWLFAASLASTAAVMVLDTSRSLQPAISIRLSGEGDAATLSATVKFVNLPGSGQAETDILGYRADKNAPPVSLFKDVSQGDATGNLSLSAEGLSKLKDYKQLVVRTRITSDGKLLYDGTGSIER